MTVSDRNVAALPGVLAEIETVAGREAALVLAWRHGGDDGWDVPRCDTAAACELSRLIGRGPAQSLMRRFGGNSIAVPLARRHVVPWLAARGMNASQIANAMHITRRTARRYMQVSI